MLPPDFFDGLLEDVAPGLRVAGTGIDLSGRRYVHPAGGCKAAEALVGLRNGKYAGRAGVSDKVAQKGVIGRQKGDVLPLRPAACTDHLKERQLMHAHAASKFMEPLQMRHVLPTQDHVEVHQQTGSEGIFHSLHGVLKNPLPARAWHHAPSRWGCPG